MEVNESSDSVKVRTRWLIDNFCPVSYLMESNERTSFGPKFEDFNSLFQFQLLLHWHLKEFKLRICKHQPGVAYRCRICLSGVCEGLLENPDLQYDAERGIVVQWKPNSRNYARGMLQIECQVEAVFLCTSDNPLIVVADDSPNIPVDDAPNITVDDAPNITVDDAPTVVVDDAPTIVVDDAPTIVVDDAPIVTVDDAPSCTTPIEDAENVEATAHPDNGGSFGPARFSEAHALHFAKKLEESAATHGNFTIYYDGGQVKTFSWISCLFASECKVEKTHLASIKLEDTTEESVDAIIHWVYTGEIDLASVCLHEVHSAAAILGLEPLANLCFDTIMESIRKESIVDLLSNFNTSQQILSNKPVVDWLLEHKADVFTSSQWNEFVVNKPLVAIDILTHLLIRSDQ
uniref:BTB domain-containing protein n=1 Tax=Trichuris muris TaxID=70415 RepID=A0A5S6Q7A2_TRIMR